MNKATITKHREILSKSSNDRSYSRSHEIKGNHPGEKSEGGVGQEESSGVKSLCFCMWKDDVRTSGYLSHHYMSRTISTISPAGTTSSGFRIKPFTLHKWVDHCREWTLGLCFSMQRKCRIYHRNMSSFIHQTQDQKSGLYDHIFNSNAHSSRTVQCST